MDPSHTPVRVTLTDEEKKSLTITDFLERWDAQETYINYMESKTGQESSVEERLKLQQQEASRRENVLVMRLSTKEQEMQELLGQIQELKQAQAPSTSQLQSMLIDPAVNLLFERMKTELTETKDRLEQAQNDLNAWKFTPDSVTGKKLMAKCRTLIQENQDLGKQLSQGRIAQLESELALQVKYSEELTGSQDEMNEFVIQLDEEVEGMQATICALQEQLKAEKNLSQSLSKENESLKHTIEQTNSITNAYHTNGSHGHMDVQQVTESIKEEVIEEVTIDVEQRLEYTGVKDEYADERTIRPSSNGDSNMSDELPMETEPSITLAQHQKQMRTDEVVDFQEKQEPLNHHISNHVTVIRTDDNNKDLECATTSINTFMSPTRGVLIPSQKTSFSINDLLSMRKDNDITMESPVVMTKEETIHTTINGDLDEKVA